MSAEAVIRSYVERVQQVNPLINAVVEDRFEAAIQDAKQADLDVETAYQHGTLNELAVQKPLLGVPLTVKESCCVKGYLFGLCFDWSLGVLLRLACNHHQMRVAD